MKKTILCSALLLITGFAQAEDIPKAPDTNANQSAAPAAVPTAPQAQVAPKPAIIDCNYKIPQDTKKVEEFIVKTWTAKAIIQAFDFKPDNIDAQLQQLKACFTNPGWEGFNTALQKSGNVEAIKAQKLNVSSQIDGQIQVTEAKENQWEVSFPLQVVYQNDKEKVTQKLQINVSVGRKVSGELGINKLIAATKNDNQPQPATPAAPQTSAPKPDEDTKKN